MKGMFAISIVLIVLVFAVACGDNEGDSKGLDQIILPTSTPVFTPRPPSPTPNPTPDIQATVTANVATAVAQEIEKHVSPTPATIQATPPPLSTTPANAPSLRPIPTPSPSEAIERVKPSVVRLISSASEGSGFIYDEKGFILTTQSVVGSDQTVTVVAGDAFRLIGTVLGRSEALDLAVVAISLDARLPAANLGNSDDVRVGDQVTAVGYVKGAVLGSEALLTRGRISARRSQTGFDYIQTDAPINTGNRGGPVMNSEGEVIGVNAFRVKTVFGAPLVGIGLALPINAAKPALSTLEAGSSFSALPSSPTPQTPSPTAGPTPTSPTQFATIDHLDPYRFKLTVPSDWASEQIDGTERLFTLRASSADDGARMVVYALEGWAFDEDTLEDLYQLWVGSIGSFAQQFHAFPPQDPGWAAPIIGGDAEYSYTDPSGPRIRGRVRLIISDRWAYILDMASLDDDWVRFQPTYIEITKRFSFSYAQ